MVVRKLIEELTKKAEDFDASVLIAINGDLILLDKVTTNDCGEIVLAPDESEVAKWIHVSSK